jgi:Uma2 family endonuclease
MISVVIKPDTLEMPAGTVVRVPGSWQDYRALAEYLCDRTSPRLKYRQGALLLMVPLPEHGKQLDVIVDMVKVLLRHQGLAFDSYHETTMALPEHSGIIPDHFFYIGQLPVVGKRQIDWSTDPPPDLAIECDVTSFTAVDDYLPYRVPELWIVRQKQIAIYSLQGSEYVLVLESRFFEGFDLNAIYQACLEDAYRLGSGAMDKLADQYPRRRV